ncbi:MAG: hypothetical protein KAR32_02695, partial [Candidatus Omnitrophica bacterium]|nr:hypothetical protein [Candidatus Omnitrophota bacterium]
KHMTRDLEGLTADPNKAPPGEVISIFSAPKKPPVDPVNAKKSSLGPEILVLLPEIADDYFMLATGTASSPVDHDSTLPFEHRRAVFTWPIVGLVTEKTTEKTNGGQTGKGTSSGGNAAAGSMVKLIRSLRVQPKDFVKKAVRIIERRYRIGFRLTRILGELRAHIGSTSFIHGPPLLIHSSHEEFHAVDILCSAQDEGNSRAQGSRNFFVSNNFSILGAGSTGSGSIRVPSNQGSGFRAQGSEKTTIPRQTPPRRGQDDTSGDSYLNINRLQFTLPWQVEVTGFIAACSCWSSRGLGLPSARISKFWRDLAEIKNFGGWQVGN